ncbi:LysR family transcriptional regulator [Fusibacter sp. 3D3]|uniref:LysR substrate-binding domain-containing protein n=1 Tax=Fusibacter sp. 3D3 TaxID=1048380 RepID=UPI0008529F3E|nr:LysR family transcriptional regulator [Fusibacter sp. 3D3]GAU75966.1 transcriptional regulator [Fusibacter sp. 3D3]
MDKTTEYILEVAKCGGITKAANNLYITPSALSKFVLAKEEELKLKIFRREGKKFFLTYAGERYVSLLNEARKLQQKIDSEMGRISDMYMGRLRIGFQMSLAETVISSVITEFKKEFPNFQVMLEEESSMNLTQMLLNRQLDLLITTSDSSIDKFFCTILEKGEIVLAVHPDNSLCLKSVRREGFKYPWIDLKHCYEENFIQYSEGQVFRNYFDQLFKNEFYEPTTKITVRTTKTALLCVVNQLGVVITSDLLVKQNGYSDGVRLFSFGENPRPHNLIIVTDNDLVQNEEIKHFIKVCKNYF